MLSCLFQPTKKVFHKTLKYSEERHSKQGTIREQIIFAPQLWHYINLTWPRFYGITHPRKPLGSLSQGELGFPSAARHRLPHGRLRTARCTQVKSKMWARREARSASSHPQPRAASHEVSGNRQKLFKPNEV